VIIIPNLISLGRLLAVPVAVWLILNDHMETAFWLFIAAGISDAVDGFIAKHFNAETQIGRFLDPLADKALLTSVYAILGYQGYLPLWLVILVVFRDILIIGGAILFHTVTRNLTMEPIKVSKVNTAAQIGLAAMVLGFAGFGVGSDVLVPLAEVAVGATTVLSGGAYVVIWSRRAFEMEAPE
jgi:cardiolipin synthase (CMP-forming)